MNRNQQTSKPQLLIVGGGFAGTTLATKVSSAYDVTLVDRKAYFEVTYATVRGAIDPKFAQRAAFSYADIPGIGTFVQGNVVSLSSTTCTLETGATLRFDYCAICTGSSYSSPFYKSVAALTREDRLRELAALNATIKAAKSIIIVGGGATGVEAAAEIIEAYAGKKITLISSAQRVLPTLPVRPSKYAADWLAKHRVEVILGQKASYGNDASTIVLSNGQQLTADLIIMTTGQTVYTNYLNNTNLASIRDERGIIKVDEFLSVPGFPNIFAVGDCNNVAEAKKGYLATQQALVVAANFLALAKAGSGKAVLKPYKANMGNPPVNMVSIGSLVGVGNMGEGCTCVGGCPVGMMKSKDLFVGQTRKQYGLKP